MVHGEKAVSLCSLMGIGGGLQQDRLVYLSSEELKRGIRPDRRCFFPHGAGFWRAIQALSNENCQGGGLGEFGFRLTILPAFEKPLLRLLQERAGRRQI